jgi:hypothetical protein
MNKMLTIDEILSIYDSEWVLVGDPVTDEAHHVLSGRVLAHSRDRDEVYRRAIELKPGRSAFLFTGTIPENTAVVL